MPSEYNPLGVGVGKSTMQIIRLGNVFMNLLSVRGQAGWLISSELCMIKWPAYVNPDKLCICGSRFCHKLTFFRVNRHLLHVTVFPDMIMNTPIVTNIDNSETVYVAGQGRSTRCKLTDCLLGSNNYVASMVMQQGLKLFPIRKSSILEWCRIYFKPNGRMCLDKGARHIGSM